MQFHKYSKRLLFWVVLNFSLATTQASKQVAKRPVCQKAVCSDEIVGEIDNIVQVLNQLGEVSTIVVAAAVAAAV